MYRLLSALLVVVSLLFALVGLTLMSSTSSIGGGFFLLAALLFWPSVGTKIRGMTGKAWIASVAEIADQLNSTFNTNRFTFTVRDQPGDLLFKSLREEADTRLVFSLCWPCGSKAAIKMRAVEMRAVAEKS